MDRYLVEYLSSGKCWLLVGSGPSVAMGYPTWRDLAAKATEALRVENRAAHEVHAQDLLEKGDYPAVFQAVERAIGGPQLLQVLRRHVKPSQTSGTLYEPLARWPIAVYMTTNYDDELQTHLAALGETYLSRTNSQAHMELLVGDTSGLIVKLHGDLTTETGIVLTSSQYEAIKNGSYWQYWRNKMQSIFQMQPVVVIGHSLTDPNIRHVLEAARVGSGVAQPVCWIAPDVPSPQAKEYLETFRIRVISYDNADGRHQNLATLIRQISHFIPPRVAVHVKSQIARVSQPPPGRSPAATAFLVFNRLAAAEHYEERRLQVIVAAIESALPSLRGRSFTIQQALEVAGWPVGAPLPAQASAEVAGHAVARTLIQPDGDVFRAAGDEQVIEARLSQFDLLRERFITSLELRMKREFPGLQADGSRRIAQAVETALTGYFREGGLTLATTLMTTQPPAPHLPSSMLEFITEASAQFDTLLERQAFTAVSIDAFVSAEAPEREYLGRISQGFLAFHCLGAFGELAEERWTHARETVWLIDSNVQIPALALGASTNAAFAEAFATLKSASVRLFTTWRLFQETANHLRFAERLIREQGADSPSIIAAAMGDAPRYRSNQFLEGFVRWRAAGNPADWERYVYAATGKRQPTDQDLMARLEAVGLEVVDLSAWPGFAQEGFARRDDLTERIKQATQQLRRQVAATSADYDEEWLDAKAQPEAEAVLIIGGERDGQYHILSTTGQSSPAWFISSTSLLNAVAARESAMPERITWQPEAFLGFVSTLVPALAASSAEGAFERLLWSFARSGVTLLDEATVQAVFGGVIDEATLAITEQRELYNQTVAAKYGESPEAVLGRMRPSARPLAALQLEKEMAQVREGQVVKLQREKLAQQDRAKKAEGELAKVDRFRKRMQARQDTITRHRRAKAAKRGSKRRKR